MDVRVSLRDGAYHEMDSSWTAFEIAARSAMRKGVAQAGVRLLEPIMDVLVVTPSEFAKSVIDDISSRQGRIRNQKRRGDTVVILAAAPLAHLLGYALALRSITNGRANSRMRFREYAAVQDSDGPDGFSPAVGLRA
jgi:elongation factor G